MRTPKNKLPDTIWLIPESIGSDEMLAWCDTPTPTDDCVVYDAEKYLKSSSASPVCYGAWISVDDKLPEIDEFCLWHYPDGKMSVFEIDKDMEFGYQPTEAPQDC